MQAGCQPHWRLFSVEGMPTCQNLSELKKYNKFSLKIILDMDSDERFQKTNCLLPCTFMEYQVSNIAANDIANMTHVGHILGF